MALPAVIFSKHVPIVKYHLLCLTHFGREPAPVLGESVQGRAGEINLLAVLDEKLGDLVFVESRHHTWAVIILAHVW